MAAGNSMNKERPEVSEYALSGNSEYRDCSPRRGGNSWRLWLGAARSWRLILQAEHFGLYPRGSEATQKARSPGVTWSGLLLSSREEWEGRLLAGGGPWQPGEACTKRLNWIPGDQPEGDCRRNSGNSSISTWAKAEESSQKEKTCKCA